MTLLQNGPVGGIGTPPSPPPRPYDAPPRPNEKIVTIEGRADLAIDQIGLIWRNTVTDRDRASDRFGGNGGSAFERQIPPGEYLTKIQGWTGYQGLEISPGENREFHVLRGLVFETQNGTALPMVGKKTEFPFFFECPDGFQIVGIFGRSGGFVDQMGVYIEAIPYD